MRAFFVAVVLCALRATARACDVPETPTHFELFDRADQVVVATPTSVPAKEVGDVTLEVERALGRCDESEPRPDQVDRVTGVTVDIDALPRSRLACHRLLEWRA